MINSFERDLNLCRQRSGAASRLEPAGYDEEFIFFAGNGITVALEVGLSAINFRITASTCAFSSNDSEAFAASKLVPKATRESASHDAFQPSSSVQKLHSNETGATTRRRTAWVDIYAPPKERNHSAEIPIAGIWTSTQR
jgi:hypothetical protein